MSHSPSITAKPIPGGWAEREVRIAGRAFHIILPREPDEFLNQLAEPAATEPAPRDPYWAQLWSAALPLAETVARAPWPAGTEVLELGCGIGLVGLAALARGYRVTFTDLVPEAVELALENAARNGFEVSPLGHAAGPNVVARGLAFDWRAPPPLPRFPVVLGSDVLYYTAEHEALLGLLEHVLAPQGVCWISDPGRSAAAQFLARATERGFAMRLRDGAGNELLEPAFGHYQEIELRKTTKPE